jgi:hypothetical protein
MVAALHKIVMTKTDATACYTSRGGKGDISGCDGEAPPEPARDAKRLGRSLALPNWIEANRSAISLYKELNLHAFGVEAPGPRPIRRRSRHWFGECGFHPPAFYRVIVAGRPLKR